MVACNPRAYFKKNGPRSPRKSVENRLDKFLSMNRWNTLIEHKSSILELIISTLKNEYGQGPK